jgi:hypothetical protein
MTDNKQELDCREAFEKIFTKHFSSKSRHREACEEIWQAARAKPVPDVEIIELGNGNKGVSHGTFDGKPAVFIETLNHAGKIGEFVNPKPPQDKISDGTLILTFPTIEQAKLVDNSLCNTPTPPSKDVGELVGEIDGQIEAIDLNQTIRKIHSSILEDCKRLLSKCKTALTTPSQACGELVEAVQEMREFIGENLEEAKKDSHMQLIYELFGACETALATPKECSGDDVEKIKKFCEDRYEQEPAGNYYNYHNALSEVLGFIAALKAGTGEGK